MYALVHERNDLKTRVLLLVKKLLLYITMHTHAYKTLLETAV